MANTTNEKEPVIIKKYANRRLYNTETSSYVTLEYLAQMVKDGRDFVVRDAKTGDDITHTVLTQIIFEEEGKGQTLLPTNFLRQLISFYGNGMQAVIPGYLEATMEMFSRNQEQYRKYVDEHFPAAAPMKALTETFEEMARQNMAAFERATRLFTPFGRGEEAAKESAKPAGENKPSRSAAEEDTLLELKNQLQAMQKQLDTLAKKGSE